MPIIVSQQGGSDRTEIPAGLHLAICYRVCDVGVQPDTGYGAKHKIILSFELPNETVMVDGVAKPAGISAIYQASLYEKSILRKDLERWRGKAFTAQELAGFDLAKLLGAMCMLSIKANNKGKSVVDGVNPVPRGTPKVEPYNPLVEWGVSQGRSQVFETLPNFIQKMALASLEWTKAAAPVPTPAAVNPVQRSVAPAPVVEMREAPGELPPGVGDEDDAVPF